MHLSDRISGIVQGGSDGWEVHERALAMRDAGEPVTFLTVGDHDVPTPEPFMDALVASLRGGNTGYPPVRGSRALREAVAARVAAQTGAPVEPAQVVVTPGGQAALFAAMMAVLDPGDECIILDPYYATFDMTVRAAGGVAVRVAARAEDGFQPDTATVAAAVTGRTRAILVNSPNNPTGAVYTEATLAGLAELAIRRDLWIVSDEVYESQVHDGDHRSIRGLPGMAERTVVTGSMSKSHVMTGWRLGWVVGPPAAARAIGDLATTTTYGVPGFIQAAALAALTDGEAEAARIAARYRRRRGLAMARLEGRPGISVHPAEGGMYLMADIRRTGLTGIGFATHLLDTRAIAVMPGESFGRAAAGHVRIALTIPDAELGAALDSLAEAAAELAEMAGARAVGA